MTNLFRTVIALDSEKIALVRSRTLAFPGIGSHSGKRVRIALRINPDDQAQGGAMQMGGKPAPFGIDEEQLDTIYVARTPR